MDLTNLTTANPREYALSRLGTIEHEILEQTAAGNTQIDHLWGEKARYDELLATLPVQTELTPEQQRLVLQSQILEVAEQRDRAINDVTKLTAAVGVAVGNFKAQAIKKLAGAESNVTQCSAALEALVAAQSPPEAPIAAPAKPAQAK